MTDIVRIADIQTSKLHYYDPDNAVQCYAFCRKRNIDCLPCIEEPRKFYRRDDARKGFVQEDIGDERMVDGFLNAFHPGMLERFRANHLLFVHSHGEVTGVVHFADYNRSLITTYLYERMYQYETALRRLLELKQLKNADMIDYFCKSKDAATVPKDRDHFERREKAARKRATEFENLPMFQSFYLDDLIGLAEHRRIIRLGGEVIQLRNHVMHAHELVNRDNIAAGDFIYGFDTFAKFFELAMLMLRDLKRVTNRIAFHSEGYEPSALELQP